jgi:hypothetical protein
VRTATTIRAALAAPNAGVSPRGFRSDAAKSATSFLSTSAMSSMPCSVHHRVYLSRSRRYAATVLADRPRSIAT